MNYERKILEVADQYAAMPDEIAEIVYENAVPLPERKLKYSGLRKLDQNVDCLAPALTKEDLVDLVQDAVLISRAMSELSAASPVYATTGELRQIFEHYDRHQEYNTPKMI